MYLMVTFLDKHKGIIILGRERVLCVQCQTCVGESGGREWREVVALEKRRTHTRTPCLQLESHFELTWQRTKVVVMVVATDGAGQ